jgi:hypothetical protein
MKFVAVGIAVFCASVAAGLAHWGSPENEFVGTVLALSSALLWAVGGVLSVTHSKRPIWSAAVNVVAACCCGAAVGYLMSADKLSQFLGVFVG